MTARDKAAAPSLPAAIIKLRQQLGLSQKKLGEKVGVAERTVKRWESGAAVPQRKHRPALIELGLDPRLFLSPETRAQLSAQLRAMEGQIARMWQLLE